jgi:hypothetical protein
MISWSVKKRSPTARSAKGSDDRLNGVADGSVRRWDYGGHILGTGIRYMTHSPISGSGTKSINVGIPGMGGSGWSALLEDAQCLGKPIIASDLEVHQEQNPPMASYFPVGDSKGLASEIEKLWSIKPMGYDEMAEKNGLARQIERGKDFAHRFISIAWGIAQDYEK